MLYTRTVFEQAPLYTMSTSLIKPKPKPPPYPRPVPSVVVEELPTTSADTLFPDVASSSQQKDETPGEAGRRAAKRRRIEACATAYLRGESLYIMSAQLKGPFKPGWKNPWAKERKRGRTGVSDQNKSLEIAETLKRTSTRLDEETTDRLAIADTTQRFTSPESKAHHFEQQGSSVQQPPSPFVDLAKSPTDPESKVPTKAKERRVEEWLRRNESFAKKSEVQVLSSPTPLPRPQRKVRESPDSDVALRTSQSEPIVGRESVSLTFEPRSSRPSRHSRRVSEAVQQVQRASRNMQNIVTESIMFEPGQLHDGVRKLTNSSSKNVLDSSRAEFAILKAKRGLLESMPAKAHLSPFEYRKTAKADQQQVQQGVSTGIGESRQENGPSLAAGAQGARMLDAKDNEQQSRGTHDMEPDTDGSKADLGKDRNSMAAPPQRQVNSIDLGGSVELSSDHLVEQIPRAPERAFAAANSALRPNLTTARSEVSTTDLPPSAQPRLEHQQSTSSAVRDDKLQSIQSLQGNGEQVGKEADDGSVLENMVKVQQDEALEAVRGERRDKIASEQGGSTSNVASDVADCETQDLLNGIEPPELSAIKQLKRAMRKETPTTAVKTRVDRKRKKTSFAIDPSSVSSRGSIQDVMKARISKKLDSPPPLLLAKDDVDLEVSDKEDESVRKRPRRLSSTGNLRSILKSANQSSSPTALRRSKRQAPDGENRNALPIPSGQNGVRDDHFDLDAAIDDLGSFLGTWDAEQEASSMLDIEL